MSYILTHHTKVKLCFLLVMTIGNAFLELAGVATIYPVLDIIMNPDIIYQNEIYTWLMHSFKLSNSEQFLILICTLLIIVYVIKNLYYLFLIRFQFHVIYQDEANLSKRLHNIYIDQDYLFHVSHNASELITNINVSTIHFYSTLLALIHIFTDGCMVLALGVYLFLTDPLISLGIVIVLGLSMGLFMLFYRRKSKKIGAQMREANYQNQKVTLEAYNGIKEIKAFHREDFFKATFSLWRSRLAETREKHLFYTGMPKPIMELCGISAVLVLLIIQISVGVDLQLLIPSLSVMAFAAMRLMPAISRIVGDLNNIVVYKPAIDALYENFLQAEVLEKQRITQSRNLHTTLDLQKEIVVQDIWFRYPQGETDILQSTNLVIRKSEFVALVGPSGAGKSTLADIILGIIHPQQGKILSDGVDVRLNLDQWHRMVGYIPQSIYLMDDSIRANVAFGFPPEKTDEKQIWAVLEKAQLAEFVRQLPDGLDTRVGDRGVMLSGGQRQRIGIARALYTDPDVLVLDEATSALDIETEEAVMNAIDSFKGEKTLIVIAHRLTTLRNCDRLFEVTEQQVISHNKSGMIDYIERESQK